MITKEQRDEWRLDARDGEGMRPGDSIMLLDAIDEMEKERDAALAKLHEENEELKAMRASHRYAETKRGDL